MGLLGRMSSLLLILRTRKRNVVVGGYAIERLGNVGVRPDGLKGGLARG